MFSGRIVRTARAVDAQSRTLLTEVQIYNPHRVLLPGMYAQIRIAVERTSAPLVVPATALLPVTEGVQVLEVDADRRIHRRTIDVVRDYGAYVEADTGVSDGSTVVLNPGDGLAKGSVGAHRTGSAAAVRHGAHGEPDGSLVARHSRVHVIAPPSDATGQVPDLTKARVLERVGRRGRCGCPLLQCTTISRSRSSVASESANVASGISRAPSRRAIRPRAAPAHR